MSCWECELTAGELTQCEVKLDTAKELLQDAVNVIDLLDWENDPDPNIVRRIEIFLQQAREALEE